MSTAAMEPFEEDDDGLQDAEYQPGDWWAGRGPTPSRPLVAGRCEFIKPNNKRCKNWQAHGLRLCAHHSGLRNLPNVQEWRDKVVANVRIQLMGSAQGAVDTITDLSQNALNENVRLKAATEILDRIGVRGGTELAVESTVEFSLDPSEALRARLEQLRDRAPAPVLDANVVEGEIVEEQDQLPLFGEEDA